jgi:YHS domain-containing protein
LSRRAAAALLGAACALLTLGAPEGAAQRLVPGRIEGFPRIEYADSTLSLNDRCIVQKNRLNTSIRPVYVNGRPIAFCCTTCPEVFVQDPEPYLRAQNIRLNCIVHPDRPAILAPTTRVGVNWELFYFSSRAARAEFERDPLRWCGRLTDPVNGVRFRPDAHSPHVTYRGRRFYFTSAETRDRFVAAPQAYAVRTGA